MKQVAAIVAVFLAGLAVGGYLFSKSLPRSFLAVSDCENRCYRPSDLAGLLASAAIQQTPSVLPTVAKESNECLAIRHPRPEARIHYVLFPKRDVRNVLELTDEDRPYVWGCFALARSLVEASGVENYRLYTNGPRLQHLTYLHFHVVAR